MGQQRQWMKANPGYTKHEAEHWRTPGCDMVYPRCKPASITAELCLWCHHYLEGEGGGHFANCPKARAKMDVGLSPQEAGVAPDFPLAKEVDMSWELKTFLAVEKVLDDFAKSVKTWIDGIPSLGVKPIFFDKDTPPPAEELRVGEQLQEVLDAARRPAREDALAEAIALITGDRNNQYGPPTQDFQRTADMLNGAGYRLGDELLRSSDVALIMAILKVSRLVWQREKRDSWVDLAGYAGCGWECSVEEQPKEDER